MRSKKSFRIFLWFAIPLILLFGGVQLYFMFYLDDKLKDLLQDAVQEQTEGTYRLEIGELDLNIFRRSISFSSISLIPLQLREARQAKYSVVATKGALLNFKILPFLRHRELIVERMDLRDPSLSIYRNDMPVPESDPKAEDFTLYGLLKGKIRSLEIRKIRVSNASVKVYDHTTDSFPTISSRNNMLFISRLTINEEAEKSGSMFLADKVEVEIHKFSYTSPDSLYTIEVGKLYASYTDSLLRLDSIRLIPNYTKRAFTVQAGEQTDRVNLSVLKAEFSQMDVKLFFEKNAFLARQLELDGLDVSVFRDKNYRRKNKRVKSVQQILRSIPVRVDIASIKLNKSHILYEEKEVGATIAGKIFFNKAQATIKGFSNNSIYFSGNHKLVVDASGMFMNMGKLKMHYSFPLNASGVVFDCSGSLAVMPLSVVNPMLEPNANVSIREGMLDSMLFAFHANHKSAKGSMRFAYHGLKIMVLNKKDGESRAWEHIKSMLAHRLFIREENPSKGEALRVTVIDQLINPERFIFNYSWKALLSGIKPAIAPGRTKKKK